MQPGSTQDQGSTRSARIRCSLRTADAATADRGTRHRDATRSPGLPGGWAAALGPSRLAARCLVAASIGLAGGTALGDDRVPAEFRGADLALGERLIRENKCSECHIRRVGGDGNAIYRPAGRISRPAALLAMVEMCNTELKLQLFPEDVQAMAAVLQRDHYRFKATP
jgi:hypothetical protein